MSFSTEMEGFEEVDALLTKIAPREANNIMRATVHGVAGDLAKKARKIAPDDPLTQGDDFKRSIKTKRERGSPGKYLSTVRVLPRAFYWWFLEYGTKKMSERPTFTKVVQEFRIDAAKIYKEQFVKKFTARLKRANK